MAVLDVRRIMIGSVNKPNQADKRLFLTDLEGLAYHLAMQALPLDVLPTFLAVARSGSMRAAAESLHLSHSAISQQIRLLEERLGFAVFLRLNRRLQLTDPGRLLLAATETSLVQLEQARQLAGELAAGAAPRLRLAVLPSFAQRWLLPRMTRWRAAQPALGLELVTSMELSDLPRDGLHAAIRVGPGHWRGLQAEPLTRSRWVVTGAPAAAHRLANLPPAAWTEQPLLGNVALWERWFAHLGAPRRVTPVAAFNDAGLLLQAVEADIGLGIVREVLAADALLAGRLVKLFHGDLGELETDEGFDRSIYWLAWRDDLADWPPLRALRDWLHAEMATSEQALALLG